MGNAVKINDRIIPAVCIQTGPEFPCWKEGHYYGIYFEVMFEDGSLWVVNSLNDLAIISIDVFKNFAEFPSKSADTFINCRGWDQFLYNYDTWLMTMDAIGPYEIHEQLEKR